MVLSASVYIWPVHSFPNIIYTLRSHKSADEVADLLRGITCWGQRSMVQTKILSPCHFSPPIPPLIAQLD